MTSRPDTTQAEPTAAAANGEDPAALERAARILDAVPRGQLDLAALIQVQRAVISPSHPYAGLVRDTPAVVRLRGAVLIRMPAPDTARRFAQEALRCLDEQLQPVTEPSAATAQAALVLGADICCLLMHAHPFADGNGRTARAVGSWVLTRSGYRLRANPRAYCRTHIDEYYAALITAQGTAPADAGPWRSFFAQMAAACYTPPTTPLDGRPGHVCQGIIATWAQRTAGAAADSGEPEPREPGTGQLVELFHDSPAAKIYYTTDGTDPTPRSHLYVGEFLVTPQAGQPVTVTAIAVIPGAPTSPAVSRQFLIPAEEH